AERFFPVATAQNRYNLVDRSSEAVLDRCAEKGVGFIPWYPLAAGDLAKPGSVLADMAKKRKATPSQLALAWVLKRSPVMLPIPGTGKVKHLEENVAAAAIELSDAEFRTLDEQGRKAGSAPPDAGSLHFVERRGRPRRNVEPVRASTQDEGIGDG